MSKRVRASAAAVTAALLVAACSTKEPVAEPSLPAAASTPGVVPSSAAVTDADDWPTYHRDNERSGAGAAQPAASRLTPAWRARLDGAVYGQPLVIGGRVLAATEHDTVYALNAADGAVLWSRHVGPPAPLSSLPCGNIDPLGITATMAYDADTGLVFALAETTGGTHTLYGIDVASGAVRLQRVVEAPLGDKQAHQQRSALTVFGGKVYVAYGGLAGDCAEYIGSVVAVPTSGDGDLLSYAIPTPREGGIWSPGGGIVVGDKLYYAVGKGESTTGFDGSDSVIALDASLHRTDLFAPSTWADDNANDLDLGSMTPAVVNGSIVIAGKRGTAYGHVVAEQAIGVAPHFASPTVAGGRGYVGTMTGVVSVTY